MPTWVICFYIYKSWVGVIIKEKKSWVRVILCVLRTQTIYIVSLRVSIKYLSISEIKPTCEELQCFEPRNFLVHIQTHLRNSCINP